LPPSNTAFCGNKEQEEKKIDISMIPVKKNNENKKFLIILIKS